MAEFSVRHRKYLRDEGGPVPQVHATATTASPERDAFEDFTDAPADPGAGIALGYVMNLMGSRLIDDRAERPW